MLTLRIASWLVILPNTGLTAKLLVTYRASIACPVLLLFGVAAFCPIQVAADPIYVSVERRCADIAGFESNFVFHRYVATPLHAIGKSRSVPSNLSVATVLQSSSVVIRVQLAEGDLKELRDPFTPFNLRLNCDSTLPVIGEDRENTFL